MGAVQEWRLGLVANEKPTMPSDSLLNRLASQWPDRLLQLGTIPHDLLDRAHKSAPAWTKYKNRAAGTVTKAFIETCAGLEGTIDSAHRSHRPTLAGIDE
jgi:hypothetical protein